MRYWLTQEEMDKIELFCEAALASQNKNAAQFYITKIDLICDDLFGASRILIEEMTSAVLIAVGRVSDKSVKVNTANQLIAKAKMFCVKE